MKSKKLISTVLVASIMCGGLLLPNSPVYKTVNSNKSNIAQAQSIGKFLNIEKRYDITDISENPTIEELLKKSKPATDDMLWFSDDGYCYGILSYNIPHDNSFYYKKWIDESGNEHYNFVKVLSFKASSNDCYNIYEDYADFSYVNGKIKRSEKFSDVACGQAGFDKEAFNELRVFHVWKSVCSGSTGNAFTDGKTKLPDYAVGEIPPDDPNAKPAQPPSQDNKPTTSVIKGKEFTRLSGNTRYDTNLDIVKSWDRSSVLVLCNGQNFPDALSAAPLATKYKAPIMLVNGELTDEQVAEVERLGVRRVYFVGGSCVVPEQICAQLSYIGVNDVKRLARDDRFDTCMEVAKEVGFSNGYAVVNGDNFPDALSVAPVAAKKGMPIILTHSQDLEPKMKALLKDKPKTGNIIAGGACVVSDKIKSQTGGTRLSGSGRYDTNYEVLNHFKDDLDFSTVYIANGENFPDALSVTALAGKNNAPLVITNTNVHSSVAKLMKGKNYKKATFIGGECVTPSKLRNGIE